MIALGQAEWVGHSPALARAFRFPCPFQPGAGVAGAVDGDAAGGRPGGEIHVGAWQQGGSQHQDQAPKLRHGKGWFLDL